MEHSTNVAFAIVIGPMVGLLLGKLIRMAVRPLLARVRARNARPYVRAGWKGSK